MPRYRDRIVGQRRLPGVLPPGRGRVRAPVVGVLSGILTVGLLAPSASAIAAWRQSTGSSLSVSGVAYPGSQITITGSDFGANAKVQLLWDGSANGMPATRTTAQGSFATRTSVPASAVPGPHSVAAATNGRLLPWGADSSSKSGPYASTLVYVQVLSATPAPWPTPTSVTASAPPTPSPAPTPSPTPRPTASPSPTSTPRPTPSPSPTASPSPSPTPRPTATPSPTSTPRPTPSPSPVSTLTPTPAPTPTPVCGTSLQAAINAAATGSTLNLSGCIYDAGATISKPLTLVGAGIRPPSGHMGLVITSGHVTIDAVTITGVQFAAYNSDEMGIYAVGSAASPLDELTIRNSTIGDLGYGGMYLRYVTHFVIQNNTVHDGVYAGIMVLSGLYGQILDNIVQRIGVYGAAANGNNAYGIALSRGVGDLTTDPRSSDIVVSGNTVDTVPTWHAYDTHSGQRITWSGNIARGSRSGIFVTGSGSPSGTVRALDNDINGNTVYGFSGSYWAITSVFSTGGDVLNNTVVSWPAGQEILTTSGGDSEATAIDLTVSGNKVQ